MNRRRDVLKEISVDMACLVILIFLVIYLGVFMVLSIPTGILWLISPKIGDRVFHFLFVPLAVFLDGYPST